MTKISASKAHDLRYQICISGAARGASIETGKDLCMAAAREIVRRGHIVTTGATRGLPYYGALAAKVAGGTNITSIWLLACCQSASTCQKYRLPLDPFDTVLFTGFEHTAAIYYSSDQVTPSSWSAAASEPSTN
ncbi:hypothetical protein IPG36_07170 [bacterium]|nr:MAG: hypothetical protein IPG36_07170 [bacterium]